MNKLKSVVVNFTIQEPTGSQLEDDVETHKYSKSINGSDHHILPDTHQRASFSILICSWEQLLLRASSYQVFVEGRKKETKQILEFCES